MADVKEIQELAKILNLQNVANGTIDLMMRFYQIRIIFIRFCLRK